MFANRFFDDGLAVGHAVKLAADGSSFYRKSVFSSDEFFPGSGKGSLEKFFIASCLKFGNDYLNSFSGSEAKVCGGGIFESSFEGNPSVFRNDILCAHAFHFAGKHTFKSQKAGTGYSEFFHLFSPNFQTFRSELWIYSIVFIALIRLFTPSAKLWCFGFFFIAVTGRRISWVCGCF